MLMYFPDYRLRFIRTPKNACSTVIHSLGRSITGGENPHDYEAILGTDPGASQDWPIIAVHRDPYRRLISGYLDKLIEPKPHEQFARDTVNAVLGASSNPRRYEQGITFREFVEYVCSVGDDLRDMHWKRQSHFLRDHRPDILLNFESLNQQWSWHPFLKEIPLKQFAPHATGGGIELTRSLIDVAGSKIEGFREVAGRHPSSSCFMDEELEGMVRAAFADDYNITAEFADAIPVAPPELPSPSPFRRVKTAARSYFSHT